MHAPAWMIRQGTLADTEVLVEFNLALAAETESKELPKERVARGVERGLRQGDEVTYYLAETPTEVIGALMLTREWSDWRDGWIIWIQSVYVREAHRGQGVFRSLLQSVVHKLEQTPDVIGVRLYVEKQNQAAQSVYAKCGFDDPNYKVMELIF